MTPPPRAAMPAVDADDAGSSAPDCQISTIAAGAAATLAGEDLSSTLFRFGSVTGGTEWFDFCDEYP